MTKRFGASDMCAAYVHACPVLHVNSLSFVLLEDVRSCGACDVVMENDVQRKASMCIRLESCIY